MASDSAPRRSGPWAGADQNAGDLPQSSRERLDEVARILALGILRLRARREREKAIDPNHLSRFGLDFEPDQSVCVVETDNDGEDE